MKLQPENLVSGWVVIIFLARNTIPVGKKKVCHQQLCKIMEGDAFRVWLEELELLLPRVAHHPFLLESHHQGEPHQRRLTGCRAKSAGSAQTLLPNR